MATFTPISRSTSTFTKINRSAGAVFDTFERSGTGWDYNEVGLTYNEIIDPTTSLQVLYNGVGTVASWTNINRN